MTMYAISPSGTKHAFPTARHAVPEDDHFQLFTSVECSEWVADVPKTWAVVAGPMPAADRPVEPYQADQRKRTRVYVFGFPLLTFRTGFDA